MSSSPTATPEPRRRRPTLRVGDERVVEVLRIAHGGHAIAHADGSVLLIRHALPGETVRVRVTEVDRRVVRADATQVLAASPDRVASRCAHAGPGGCGGCDFQHVALAAQRRLKGQVLVEALRRFGGVEVDPDEATVVELPGAPDGLHWRTRMRWVSGADGRLGLRAHRRHDVVPIDSCAIAAPGLDPGDLAPILPVLAPGSEVVAARGVDGRVAAAVDGEPVGRGMRVLQEVDGRTWRVRPTSFWQVHPGLAGALASTVLDLGRPGSGERWWDLYAGAGLFAACLAGGMGPGGNVDAVESSSTSVAEGRRALHDLPTVTLHEAPVARWLADRSEGPDGVVIDPPRTGAERPVLEALARLEAPRIVYVACDPVALGRDVGVLSGLGYRLAAVRAFDAFPMTHHVESVALLVATRP